MNIFVTNSQQYIRSTRYSEPCY